MHSHKMEPNLCVPNPDFPGTIVNLDVLYQSNSLRYRIKRSGLHLSLWVQNRFLCITYRRCMTASATPYAKDFWNPILGYRDGCFVIVIPLMMIFLMECSTTPILMKSFLVFIRIIPIV